MDALFELLAKSGANVGLAAYSVLVTLALVAVDKERKANAKMIIQQMKDSNDALAPIEKVVTQCLTMLDILTRGRK